MRVRQWCLDHWIEGKWWKAKVCGIKLYPGRQAQRASALKNILDSWIRIQEEENKEPQIVICQLSPGVLCSLHVCKLQEGKTDHLLHFLPCSQQVAWPAAESLWMCAQAKALQEAGASMVVTKRDQHNTDCQATGHTRRTAWREAEGKEAGQHYLRGGSQPAHTEARRNWFLLLKWMG